MRQRARGYTRAGRALVAALWIASLALLTTASLLPAAFKRYSRTDGPLHVAVHEGCYAWLAFLSSITLPNLPGVVQFVIAGSIGILLEWIQARKYGIALELHDVFSNVTGALIGVLIANAVSSAFAGQVDETTG